MHPGIRYVETSVENGRFYYAKRSGVGKVSGVVDLFTAANIPVNMDAPPQTR